MPHRYPRLRPLTPADNATALAALIPEVVQLDRDAARKRAEHFCSLDTVADQ
ncbi:hypothetical protein J7E90_30735 [Streptomyces sp. ISL-111]|uniref:hypothetical protein n=1 Tax=Streptomyces sp. ISL-111 TaxID=2819175 RepID=UPI001BE6B42F|nr:hypothetical protein [Streptomyces sp. ISL-111]MBT2381546.1 hypothetical protein [Streptomyces sp. ISL-111]